MKLAADPFTHFTFEKQCGVCLRFKKIAVSVSCESVLCGLVQIAIYTCPACEAAPKRP